MFLYLDLMVVGGLLCPPLIGVMSVRLADRMRNSDALFGSLWAAIAATVPASICAATVWFGGMAGVEVFTGQLGQEDAPGLIVAIGLISLLTIYLVLVGMIAGAIAYYRHRRWEMAIEYGGDD